MYTTTPHYHDGIFREYTNLNIYLLTEDELVENFKIIKDNGTLEDIRHSGDNKKLQQNIKEIQDYFKNISNEELEKLLTKN